MDKRLLRQSDCTLCELRGLFKHTILNWQNFVMFLIFNCLVEVVCVLYYTSLVLNLSPPPKTPYTCFVSGYLIGWFSSWFNQVEDMDIVFHTMTGRQAAVAQPLIGHLGNGLMPLNGRGPLKQNIYLFVLQCCKIKKYKKRSLTQPKKSKYIM